MGDNAGSFTLDKSDLQFDALVAKSMGADLGQAIAAEAAKRYADSTPVSSSASSLLDDDEDEADEEDFTASESEDSEVVASEDATMDVVETTTAKAKTTK
jgi:hypothetical protein